MYVQSGSFHGVFSNNLSIKLILPTSNFNELTSSKVVVSVNCNGS